MIDFETYERLSKLSPREQELFRSVLSRAMAGKVLRPAEGIFAAQDREWVFIEKHHDLLSRYLDPLGWEFVIYPALMRARAVHKSGEHKVRLNMEHSLVAAILRQLYHERASGGQLGLGTRVRVAEIRDRYNQATRGARLITAGSLETVLRRLGRLQLVQVPRGFRGSDHEEVDIDAFIEIVLTPERIRELFELHVAGRGDLIGDDEGEGAIEIGTAMEDE